MRLPLRALYVISFFTVLSVICLGIIISRRTTPQVSAPVKGKAIQGENLHMWGRKQTSKFGYVMATHYSDQMTGSMANLASLQCLVSALDPDIRLVEPFLRHSLLGVNLYATYSRTIRREVPPYDDNSVALSNIVDMLEWEKYAQGKENRWSPQIGWDSFIKDAPRQLIIVYKVTNESHVIDATDFYTSSKEFYKHHGFEIVRNISLTQQVYSEKEIKKAIYGHYKPREAVVLLSSWGGCENHGDGQRIKIPGKIQRKCLRNHFFKISNFPPSSKILRDANRYTEKYLDKVYGYISVMVRIEHLILRYDLADKTKEQILSITIKCFHNLLSELTALKDEHGTEKIFLTLDCRKSGSQEFGSELYSDIATTAVDTVFPMLYGNSTTLDEWDKSFEDVATHNTPGYIAMLQKHLAAKGVCLLTVGGGRFQDEARQLHSSYHPNGPNCAKLVSEC